LKLRFNDGFTLQSVLLRSQELSKNHTSLNLSNKIYLTLKEWNIETKIIIAVSDNANNIKIALSILQLQHLGCFSFTLNLIVQSALTLTFFLHEKI
jgi:hypothetical protein